MSRQTRSSAAVARSLFVEGVRNAHALEKEAEELIRRQLEGLRGFPDLTERLRTHLEETRHQCRRLDRILESMDESPSILKDAVLQAMGAIAALSRAPASDEVLKDVFADMAFEHYEIGAYRSLVTLAEEAGFNREAEILRESLREEEDMARWLEAHVEALTRDFLARSSGGHGAAR